MLAHLRPAVMSTLLFTLILGVAYPLGITGVARLAFPAQAEGSLVRRDGKVVGSALIGQGFAGAAYLHPRPSAAGMGYDGANSSGSNLGPLNPDLTARERAAAAAVRADTVQARVPADAVTTSASGLDPDISPAYAAIQVQRIAAARRADPDKVRAVIADQTRQPLLGFIGQPGVNVLMANLALDRRFPPAAPRPPG